MTGRRCRSSNSARSSGSATSWRTRWTSPVRQASTCMPYVNPPVTVSVILHRNGRVLFGVRGNEDGRGKLDLPGGFLEAGECLEECARRECREELGTHIGELEYMHSLASKYSDGREILCVYF